MAKRVLHALLMQRSEAFFNAGNMLFEGAIHLLSDVDYAPELNLPTSLPSLLLNCRYQAITQA
jgi:hypothetical protein